MSKKADSVEAVIDRMVVVVKGENADIVSQADALGVPPETIRTWKRRGEVPAARLQEFSRDWKAPLDWLMHGGVAEEKADYSVKSKRLIEDFILVPRYDVRAGAGRGQVIHDESIVDHLAFKRVWIEKALSLEVNKLALIEVHGDSMSPTLHNGSLILVDLRRSDVGVPGIYVLKLDGHLLVKRVNRRIDGSVDVISDNPVYGTEHLTQKASREIRIIGRVVWAGGSIK